MSEFELRRRKLFDILPENSVSLLFSGVSKIRSEDDYYPWLFTTNFETLL